MNWIRIIGLSLAAIVTLSCQPLSLNSQIELPDAPVVVVTPSGSSSDSETILSRDARDAFDFLSRLRTGLTEIERTKLAILIVREADYYFIDPTLVLAVIQVESAGNPRATSRVGARGLMQLMPKTAEEFAPIIGAEWSGPDSLFDPELNVRLGVAYLSYLFNRYEDLSVGLAAYNWGPTRIDGRLRKGSSLPAIYVDLVLGVYDRTALARPAVALASATSAL